MLDRARAPRLHVEQQGCGTPSVLLIHGGADGAYVWDWLAPALADRFTVYAVDLRGHGDSGRDESGRYELADHVADLAYVIEKCGIQDLVLIGHSLGGRIATCLGARLAHKMVASVLVDFAPELNPDGLEQADIHLRESLRVYPSTETYAQWLSSTRPLSQTAMLSHIACRSLQPCEGGFRPKADPALLDRFQVTSPAEARVLWGLLRNQSCRTLVLRGSASAILTRSLANRMAEALPSGSVLTVPGAGHAVMLDNPVGFERAVLDFLSMIGTTPAGT